MGNCFSDPSAPKQAKKGSGSSKGHVLGSAPTQTATTPAVAVPAGTASAPLSPPMQSPGRILGDGFEDANRGNDARTMAAAAAEERMKSANKRGVQNGGGKLTAKLEAERRKPLYSNDSQDQPMDMRNYN